MNYRLTFVIATVEYPDPITVTVGVPETLARLLQNTRPRFVKMMIEENIAPTTILPLIDFKGDIKYTKEAKRK